MNTIFVKSLKNYLVFSVVALFISGLYSLIKYSRSPDASTLAFFGLMLFLSFVFLYLNSLSIILSKKNLQPRSIKLILSFLFGVPIAVIGLIIWTLSWIIKSIVYIQ